MELQLQKIVKDVLIKHSKFYVEKINLTASIEMEIVTALLGDAVAYSKRDPSTHNDVSVVIHSISSYKANIYYRIANAILKSGIENAESIARKVSEEGKILSGVEIHPAALIGNRFVIDHGYGTVIGETVIIGDDAYILAGVTLGARGIRSNINGKRHPTIGNNVEIGSFARLLGSINIGDNVFIGPYCIVTEHIPNNCKVSVVNQLQIAKKNSDKRAIKVTGYHYHGKSLSIFGDNLNDVTLSLLDSKYSDLVNVTYKVVESSFKKLRVDVDSDNVKFYEYGEPIHCLLRREHNEVIVCGILPVLSN